MTQFNAVNRMICEADTIDNVGQIMGEHTLPDIIAMQLVAKGYRKINGDLQGSLHYLHSVITGELKADPDTLHLCGEHLEKLLSTID